jgi:phosphatidylserine/phosphatidylglycerophosphate/cardiolipin synthase-like enzyme
MEAETSMPIVVTSGAGQPQALGAPSASVFVPELVPRNCRLKTYKKKAVPSFRISGEVIAYASPDSTFAVTKRLFDAAKKSIVIGIYDFTADHVKQLLVAAMNRGVNVELMLDLDGKKEDDVFSDLETLGADCTPAPSCASKNNKFFRSSHEKFIVIDDAITMVQSGNYSDHSIPLNVVDGGEKNSFKTGNRDMGLVIRSKPMAKFFKKIFNADVKLELTGAQALARRPRTDTFLIEAAPKKMPSTLFPSRTVKLTSPMAVQPILSPDNYMTVVPGLLAQARKSILIQQQYIRAKQTHIVTLLKAIAKARASNPQLDVRIVLGKIFNKSDIPKERANLEELADEFGLKLGRHIRYVDETRFVHLHNKLILIDGDGVLVSSQNWSNAAVSENREAGLWFENRSINSYFRKIFESDWSTAAKKLKGAPESLAPQEITPGKFVRVMAGDFREV